jgi:hypothetical protein
VTATAKNFTNLGGNKLFQIIFDISFKIRTYWVDSLKLNDPKFVKKCEIILFFLGGHDHGVATNGTHNATANATANAIANATLFLE